MFGRGVGHFALAVARSISHLHAACPELLPAVAAPAQAAQGQDVFQASSHSVRPTACFDDRFATRLDPPAVDGQALFPHQGILHAVLVAFDVTDRLA